MYYEKKWAFQSTPLPPTAEEKICLIRCPSITWKKIRTSLLNVLIILISKEQMHPHPLLRPLWMFPASKTVYKLFLHHIHKHEILNSVKWRWVNCSHMDYRHSYICITDPCDECAALIPMKGAGWGCLVSAWSFMRALYPIYSSNFAKFSISMFNNHFVLTIHQRWIWKDKLTCVLWCPWYLY